MQSMQKFVFLWSNSIAGMKSFHCLMHRIRNHSPLLIDHLFCLSAGLWNFKIQ
jgi:hypothetical protein